MPGQRAPLLERFWAKVDRSGGLFACWPWTGSTQTSRNNPTGYGKIQEGGRGSRIIAAHRIACVIATGEEPDGMEACHAPTCTTTLCCNPHHLRWGTRAENEADKARKREAAAEEWADAYCAGMTDRTFGVHACVANR
jgi:hypothetical protein